MVAGAFVRGVSTLGKHSEAILPCSSTPGIPPTCQALFLACSDSIGFECAQLILISDLNAVTVWIPFPEVSPSVCRAWRRRRHRQRRRSARNWRGSKTELGTGDPQGRGMQGGSSLLSLAFAVLDWNVLQDYTSSVFQHHVAGTRRSHTTLFSISKIEPMYKKHPRNTALWPLC